MAIMSLSWNKMNTGALTISRNRILDLVYEPLKKPGTLSGIPRWLSKRCPYTILYNL